MNLKKITSGLMALAMVASLAACGSTESTETNTNTETNNTTTESTTTEVADDPNRPAAVSKEDWEAMKKEPVFGKEINYLFNGGACVSAKYQAEALGYYQEYGINAKFLKGGSVVDTVGTGKAMWGTDHIATMLVPVAKGVNMTFVCGAHVGCKSIYVPADSDIYTVEDLKGKKIAIHDGVGQSDQNIAFRLLDEFGVNPTTEVEWPVIEDSAATVVAMQNGEADATVFSDYFVLANYPNGEMRNIVSLTFTEEFMDEPCCVTAMNNDFIKENPVHAKYVVMAIKRAGEYARLNSEEAVQMMFDNNMMTGEYNNQLTFWNSLYFGLSDAFTERALREIVEDYLRLKMFPGDITKDTVDGIMELAWTPVCPDELVEGLTVGDPVEIEGNVVPVQQKDSGDTVAASQHKNSWEVAATDDWADMFVPINMTGRAEEMLDFDLTPTAEEKAAMEKEPAYGSTVMYYMADGCTSGPTMAAKLGYYEEAGLTTDGFKGTSYTEALGTNQVQVAVGHIATMLVPCTNGVDLTFVGGAHIGCKSLYVLADSEYNTTADLKGQVVAVPNGIGASDYNITCLLLDADGIRGVADGTAGITDEDVRLLQVAQDASIAAMERGEIAACLMSDSYAYSMVKEGKLKCIRSLLDNDMADEPCCVIAMNATWVKENPVHAKKVVQAVQKAHSWMRSNPTEATQFMYDEDMMSGDFDMNVMLNNSLQFGLEEDFVSVSLKSVVEKYVRLGLISNADLTVDQIMEKAWTPVLNK
ncbi:MAG: ABC transporter substrate-binding protein [Oscillospiraceae bacterium]|nr:ABC transporter substrate-binding protein [Oscillospiraceae bacterium]